LIYKTTVYIPSGTIERVNSLLCALSFKDLSEKEISKYKFRTNSCETIFNVKFEDNSTLTYELCSGDSNYYDNVVWRSADGIEETIECSFRLFNEIEIEINSNKYIVNLIENPPEHGKKRLNVTVNCLATYNSSILVPYTMNLEEAIQYAEKHIDDIPLGLLEYVSDSDSIDEENCSFD